MTATDRTAYADLYETNDVRVMTDDGQLVRYTEHGQNDQAAWDDFTATVPTLTETMIVQLIVDDLIAAEHYPQYHGTVALDVTDYS